MSDKSLNFIGRVWKMCLEGTRDHGPGSINFWVLSLLRCGHENREGWKHIQTYFWDFQNLVTVQLARKHLLKTWKWNWSCSVMSDSVTPRTVAYHAPQSMGFSRQEYLIMWKSESVSRSVSLRPHGLQLFRVSVHRILQARILEWVAITFSRGSSWLRDQTLGLPCCRQIVYHLSHTKALY